jgi:hypothetical protein
MSADEIPHIYGGTFRRWSITKKADACIGYRTLLMHGTGTVAWFCTRNVSPPPRPNFQSEGVVFGGVRLTRRQCVIHAAATTTTGGCMWWVIVGVRGGTTPVGIYFSTITQRSRIAYWAVLTWLCRLSGSSRPRWTMQEGQIIQQTILRCIIRGKRIPPWDLT